METLYGVSFHMKKDPVEVSWRESRTSRVGVKRYSEGRREHP
jgi:hypothetical protein